MRNQIVKHSPLKLQRGAALLAFILVMIVGASFMLVSSLNANIDNRENIEETYQSLERAKQALIAFALTVPERSGANPRPGPGYMPCPDTDNDGNAELACGGGGVTSIGRIPYRSLEEDILRDDSGEILWYALSPNFRNIGARFTPLNSDTAGQLTLDGQADIVAVIIAPGPSLSGQNQQRDVAPNLVTNYLENENANNDANFVSYLINDNPPTFNDRVIAITRQELMAAVEKRVLSEVANTLEAYRNSSPGNEAFPWLAPFANPAPPNRFAGIINTTEGHLPLHFAGQAALDNQATMSVDWVVPNGVGNYVPAGATPPNQNCVRNAACNDPDLGVLAPPINLTDPACTWVSYITFNCTGTFVIDTFLLTPGPFLAGIPYQQIIRTYTYTVNHADTVINVTTNLNTTTQPRVRNLDTNGLTALNGTLTVQVVDVLGPPLIPAFWCNFLLGGPCDPAGERGRATLTLAAGNNADLVINGVDFHLDTDGLDLNADGDYVDAGEQAPDLPTWFVTNNWHHNTYIAYPPVANEPLPGILNPLAPASSPGVCTVGNCLVLTGLNGATVNSNNIRALAVIAGQDLTPATVRPNAVLTDYFDLDNSDLDGIFDRQLFSNIFNDQIRIIRTTAIQ